MGTNKVLCDITAHIPDIHIPFQDDRAIALVNRVLKDVKPRRIRHKGDLIDCYKESSYLTDPDYAMSIEDETEIAYTHLEEWSDLAEECLHIMRTAVGCDAIRARIHICR